MMMKNFTALLFLIFCLHTAFAQTATFILNGDTARLPKDFEDIDPLNGNFYLSSKKISINIAARMKTDITLSLKIFAIELDTATLQMGNTTALLTRRNSPMDNLVNYSSNYFFNGVQGSIKLTITNFTLLSQPSKNQYGEAIVSGIFEGDLLCSTSDCPAGEIQHITLGKFENVPVAVWK